ncbi:hypothetical protein KIN20_025867 [Parelaphostrongylus tenuis]|uniref:Uncharacterized protein n=1 Tax=Parelaphostrongylus tenuis TaxID=148309 RepID=A0AAD5MVT6_PARTN|nr:hypothetical protein KIN20_025867 [Parelaphostrongylus tenuis]
MPFWSSGILTSTTVLPNKEKLATKTLSRVARDVDINGQAEADRTSNDDVFLKRILLDSVPAVVASASEG